MTNVLVRNMYDICLRPLCLIQMQKILDQELIGRIFPIESVSISNEVTVVHQLCATIAL